MTMDEKNTENQKRFTAGSCLASEPEAAPGKNSEPQKGFTLIEVLIYLGLFVLIMGSIFQTFEGNRATFASGERKADVQANARVAMDEMSRQIRMAGYYPENFDANGANDIANANAIHVATDNTLAIYADANAAGSSNILLFCLDGTVVRTKTGPIGNAASYTCSGGDVLAENMTSLRFTYYGADSITLPNPANTPYQLDGQAPAVVPTFTTVTERAAVRRVVITLTVRQNVPHRAPQIYTLTSDVRLRNLN
jgi:Tfp pilus assembly protein PilW